MCTWRDIKEIILASSSVFSRIKLTRNYVLSLGRENIILPHMPWDESEFQARITARAKELGMTERDVMRKAGLSGDTFDKVPGSRGRTYNTIEAIAGAVGLTVGEAIGAQSAPSFTLLAQAIGVALRAIPSDRRELLLDAILSVYAVLAERRRENLPIDPSTLSALESLLRGRSR
jgi:transcriptional regulator with XRE-family HTH domain